LAAARPVPPPTRDIITGVILAGGRARRLGGVDKGLVEHAGRPLVDWVIAALRPQVRGIVINANRNQDRYGARRWPVVADRLDGFQGPLAGIASALAAVDTPWIITLPCDGPAPPADLVERLCRAITEPVLLVESGPDGSARIGAARTAADRAPLPPAELAVAGDGHRLQPVHALIPRALAPDLDAFLAGGQRRVDRWYARHRTAVADFSDQRDAFANINTAEDIARATRTAPLR
jgi:molybdopterin-guanine dinucleotide biosynthesis protein A